MHKVNLYSFLNISALATNNSSKLFFVDRDPNILKA